MRRRARGTQPEQLNSVFHLAESVLRSDRLGPRLHGIGVEFHGQSATTADQVVMVDTAFTFAVDHLAVGSTQRIHLTGIGQDLQRAVDRGQSNGLTQVVQHAVQVLGAAKARRAGQEIGDGSTLPGGAGHSSSFSR